MTSTMNLRQIEAAWMQPIRRLERQQRLLTARMYRQVGRLADAQALYADLQEEWPEHAIIRLEAGELADEMGDIEGAIEHLQAAIALDSRVHGRAMPALARVLMHAGRLPEAGRCWWRITRLRHDDLQAWAGLLVCALAAEKHGVARRAMRQVLLLGTRWQRRQMLAEHWRHVTMALAAKQRPAPRLTESPLQKLLEKAAATFEAHARRYPDRADTYYHLGICREALNDAVRAAEAAQRALAIHDKYVAAQELHRRVAA